MVRIADRTSSTSTAVITSVPIDSVPGKPWCSPLAVIAIAGATTRRGIRAATSMAIADAIRVSVPIGRCGPCCSHDPIGTSRVGVPS